MKFDSVVRIVPRPWPGPPRDHGSITSKGIMASLGL